MARQVTRLTDKQIKTAATTGKEYTLSDGDGLQLRVRANGTKSWQFKYKRPTDGKSTKLSLGTYPQLSLANARKKTNELLELIAKEIDPKQHKVTQQSDNIKMYQNSLFNVATQWFELKKDSVTPEHASREWRTLEKYIFPELGKTPLAQITAPLTISTLRCLEAEGKLSTVKRICQSLNQIMDYGTNSGIIHANPLSKIIKVFKKHQVKHMPTIEPEKLGVFLDKLYLADRIEDKTKILILWQLHTMTRPAEAVSAKWQDIDLESKLWTIPAENMKKRRAHRVPLTQEAINLLNAIHPISGCSPYVFPSKSSNKEHMSKFTANAAIKRSLELKGELVAHGLRAIASTMLHEQGFDSLLIEACLAHADENETRASYNRTDYLEQRAPIMAWWSTTISAASIHELTLSHANTSSM